MKTVIHLFIIGLLMSMLGCEKDEVSNTELSDTWIETIGRKDTIQFNNSESEKIMILRRGSEIRDGYLLPKYGSGIYRYKLKSDSIFVNNMLWNCICYNPYYFKFNTTLDTFQIGNFYDPEQDDSKILKFTKLSSK